MASNLVSAEKLQSTIDFVLNRLDQYADMFIDKFPAPQSKNYMYPAIGNTDWTSSFYTGMLWLAYELTGDEKYKKHAMLQVESFYQRITKKIGIDTHDLGFLYTLSCVSAYRLTGDETAKAAALLAADHLIGRFKEKGGFIQAWGAVDDPAAYRMIIDCLLNLPLLFWASDVTGDAKYRAVAEKHIKTACKYLVREDYTTYHTFYFDPQTGAPDHGSTHQGYSDDSCWARGQAWGVTGLAFAYHYTKDKSLIPLQEKITEVFINALPADSIPYWDLVFTSGDEPRDTSAAAIAVCGILEMEKYHHNERALDCAGKMMNSLIDNYLTDQIESNGILTEGMYNRNGGDEPECNIWGDYYFLEALMRLKNPDWKMYW